MNTTELNTAEVAIEATRLNNTRTNHLLHFILSVCTGGLWIIVWILVTVNTKIERTRSRSRLINGKTGMSPVTKWTLYIMGGVFAASFVATQLGLLPTV